MQKTALQLKNLFESFGITTNYRCLHNLPFRPMSACGVLCNLLLGGEFAYSSKQARYSWKHTTYSNKGTLLASSKRSHHRELLCAV
jgi:hypothetical protein